MRGFAVPWWIVAAMGGLVACTSGKLDGEDDTGADASAGGSIDVDDDIQFDGDGPVIVEGKAWCQAGSDSSGMIFYFDVRYADPQGDFDVDQGSVTAQDKSSGTEVFTDSLLFCREGKCEGSFRDGVYPLVTCATADGYEFLASVTDRSGLQSDTVLLTWED